MVKRINLVDASIHKLHHPPNAVIANLYSHLVDRGHDVNILKFSPKTEKPESFFEAEKSFFEELTKSKADITLLFISYRNAKRTIEAVRAIGDYKAVLFGDLINELDTYNVERDYFLVHDVNPNIVVGWETEIVSYINGTSSKLNLEQLLKGEGPIISKRSLILPKHFFPASEQLDFVELEASRGCRFRCTFCEPTRVYGEFTSTNAIDLVRLVHKVAEEYNTRNIKFVDLNFTSWQHIEEFCNNIGDGFNFFCYGRLSDLSKQKLAAMQKAGFKTIYVGIETGSDELLKKMGKGIDTNKMQETVNLVRQHGIDLEGSFIIGYPGETPETIEQTISFAKQLNLGGYHWHLFQPSGFMLENPEQWDMQINAYPNWAEHSVDYPLVVLEEHVRKHPVLFVEKHVSATVNGNPDKNHVSYGCMGLITLDRAVKRAKYETEQSGLTNLGIRQNIIGDRTL